MGLYWPPGAGYGMPAVHKDTEASGSSFTQRFREKS